RQIRYFAFLALKADHAPILFCQPRLRKWVGAIGGGGGAGFFLFPAPPGHGGQSLRSGATSTWSGAFESMDGAAVHSGMRSKPTPWAATRRPVASPIVRTRR